MTFQTPHIADLSDQIFSKLIQDKLDNKTKPLGALGQLETLAKHIACILHQQQPILIDPQLLVFAADHGIAAHAVSAYPSDVTWQMVENFLAGGAAVSVLAKQHGIALSVVDCGVRHTFKEREGLMIKKIDWGSGDVFETDAMSQTQCEQALTNGSAIIKSLSGNVVLLGEMGIANSSIAALLTSRICGADIAACTGKGTGLDETGLAHKINILQSALKRHAHAQTPIEILRQMGGFEIATLVGAVLQAALERRVIVVDGFIASAAVLVAQALQPHVLQRCVFAHCSEERGHQLLMQYLKVTPLLNLGLRLGEGSGAALAWPLLVSATAILNHMASFASAGVSQKT